nr:hypothetical protein [Tanacetum cinerariifolium]
MMMLIEIKNRPLDQTGGPRDVEKERSLSQQALLQKLLPGALTTCQMEEPSHPEFDTGAEDQPIIQSSQHPEWFSQQQKPLTPDRDWNKTMELKKILIEKMKGNKSIQRYDEQRNLYKALVKAYESNKIILDTYRETVTLKRRRDDDADKDEEPSAGPERGSKRHREGK